MSSAVTFTTQGRIGIARIDNPPVNALSHAVRKGLADVVEQALADPKVGALVIICEGKTFIAGADIKEFGKPMLPPLIQDMVGILEASTKPVIAAIHGTALGGGFEVALACHFRVATPTARVGLPEVKLGILPGAGGTQRLPRLIGAEAALKMIVEGSDMSASAAKAAGALDAIIEGDLTAGAIAFAEKILDEKRPIRRTGELTAKLDNPAIFDDMAKTVAKRQRGYLAPLKCIEAVRMACEVPFAEGSKREYAMCKELLDGPQSKAQRHMFAAEREVAKIAGVSEDTVARDVKSAAVVGTGTMGVGITMCFANVGIPVVILDRKQESLDKALKTIRKNYESSVAKGSLAQAEMDKRLGLIKSTLSYDDLADADLVIEAIFEDMAVKKDVFAKLDAVCKPGAVLATNTSYLDINQLADVTKRPQDVAGMHFFNPANVMRLLENVRPAKAAPEVLATIMKTGKKIGKLPVLVGVCDGFVGNRMLAKRSREGFFMMEEGATPWQIDKVLYDFGFPMGPYSVADLAGLDIAWANRKSRFDRLTAREQACNILDQICELGRFGQKTGSGYYKYDEKRNATPDPFIEELIVKHSATRGLTRRAIPDQEIIERCLYAMINEGAKILEEGIVPRPQEIDVIWVNGFGFPAYRGGPMFYADQIGLENVYKALLKYRDQVGEQFFTPAPLLERLAKSGKSFYNS